MAAVTNILWLNGGFPQGIASADTITAPGSWSFSGGPTAFTGNVSVSGSLDVAGDIISRDQVNVVLQDSFLDLGFGNSTETAAPGGFTVQMNKTTGFVAGAVTDFPSTSTFVYADAGSSTLLAVGDVVVISGLPAEASANEGFFVVAAVSGASFPQTVTIETSAVTSLPWAQTAFVAVDPSSDGVAFQTDMSVLAIADGTTAFKDAGGTAWPKGTLVLASIEDATKSLFQANGAYVAVGAGSTTLQNAYNNGQTINVVTAKGNLAITLTSADFTVNGGNDVDFGGSTAVSTFNVDATGAVTIDSTTGAISIGSGADAQNVNIGTAGARPEINVGSTAALDLNLEADQIDIGAGAQAHTINIGTSAFAQAIEIGDTTGASSLKLYSGSGNVVVDSGAGSLTLDSDGVLELNASGAAISIGNDADAQAINIGTGAAARTITVGNTTGATALDVNLGTGGMTVDTQSGGGISLDAVGAASNFTVAAGAGGQDLTLSVTGAYDSSVIITSAGTGADAIKLDATGTGGGILVDAASHIEINSSAGEIRIGNDNVAQDIKIGDAGARDLVIGSTAATSALVEAATIDIGAAAQAHTINIGSDSGYAQTILVGSMDSTSSLKLYSGSGNMLLDAGAGTATLNADGNIYVESSPGTLYLDGAAGLQINSYSGEILIGNDNVAGDIKIGGAGARDLYIGSTAATSIVADASQIDVGVSDMAHTINIGNYAGSVTQVSIGSGGSGSNVEIEAGTGASDKISLSARFLQLDGKKGTGLLCKNVSGGNIAPGLLLALVPASDPASSTVPEVQLADCDDATVYVRRVFGVSAEDQAVADNGSMIVASVPGTLAFVKFGTNPAEADVGKPVYLSDVAGEATMTPPSNSGDAVVQVGFLVSGTGDAGLYSVVLAPQFIGQIP